MPEAFAEVLCGRDRWKAHYRDMQDLEFTIERGKLWMLQTRNGKRTTKASLKIAVDMVADEGLISRGSRAAHRSFLARPAAAPDHRSEGRAPYHRPRACRPRPALPPGEIVFNSDEAEAMKAEGRKVILVRVETSPEDIHGMHAAQGILTTRGGMTSHAAVVARGMGKPLRLGRRHHAR
jgi:pyruvate,orthophosphate dikinase